MIFDVTEEGIKTLISRGEGSNVEFKTTLVPTKVLDSFVSAFLNSEGGIILLGVKDSGEITGLSDQENRVALSRFRRVARDMHRDMRDSASFRYGSRVIDGKNVAFLEAAHKPFVRYIGRNPITAFLIESGLILLALTSLWYLARFIYPDTALAMLLRPFRYLSTPLGLLLFCVALECFLALVFYGTSYEVTPLRLLGIFFPLDRFQRLVRTARERRAQAGLEDVLQKQEPTTSAATVPTEEMYQKVSPLPTPEQEEESAAEEEIVTNKTDELFREVSERASYLADRMEKRTNTYMILGVTMGFIGMGFWFWSFNHALSKPMGLTEFVETAIPRVTILIFIELLAGFFLRQYRIGVEDFKYFFEIEQRADWKRISYSILLANKDAAIGTFATSLANEVLAMRLQAGESTTTIEALKAEGNTTLEAMKLMGNTVKDVVQAVKAK